MDEQLTRRERRRLEREQRRQQAIESGKNRRSSAKRNRLAMYSVIILVIAGLSYGTFSLATSAPPAANNANGYQLPSGPVHWHATLSIYICGELRSIPTPVGQQHLGSPLLHTHEDALIHIEGVVTSPSDITLGKFFDFIFVKFSQTEIMDRKNGDACPNDQQGSVRMSVNGIPSAEFRDYVVMDGDRIEIRFE